MDGKIGAERWQTAWLPLTQLASLMLKFHHLRLSSRSFCLGERSPRLKCWLEHLKHSSVGPGEGGRSGLRIPKEVTWGGARGPEYRPWENSGGTRPLSSSIRVSLLGEQRSSLFWEALKDRLGTRKQKLQSGKFWLLVRKTFLIIKVPQGWGWLPWKNMSSPSQEVTKQMMAAAPKELQRGFEYFVGYWTRWVPLSSKILLLVPS